MAERTHQAMNAQIAREFESEYLYLQFAAWLAARKLPGFTRWMQVQAREERGHAVRFFQHLIDRDWATRSARWAPRPPSSAMCWTSRRRCSTTRAT